MRVTKKDGKTNVARRSGSVGKNATMYEERKKELIYHSVTTRKIRQMAGTGILRELFMWLFYLFTFLLKKI